MGWRWRGKCRRCTPGEMTGVIRGKWGFDDWVGPRFRLHSAGAGKWTVAPGSKSALVVGREDALRIEGNSTLCVDGVKAQSSGGNLQEIRGRLKARNA